MNSADTWRKPRANAAIDTRCSRSLIHVFAWDAMAYLRPELVP